EWCSCHGLLGILLHEARMVAFPPVFQRSLWLEEAHLTAQQGLPRLPPRLRRVARGRHRHDLLAPTQRLFMREGDAWGESLRQADMGARPQPVKEGDLVPPGQFPPSWQAGVLADDIAGYQARLDERLALRPIDTAWARFFPTVPWNEC